MAQSDLDDDDLVLNFGPPAAAAQSAGNAKRNASSKSRWLKQHRRGRGGSTTNQRQPRGTPSSTPAFSSPPLKEVVTAFSREDPTFGEKPERDAIRRGQSIRFAPAEGQSRDKEHKQAAPVGDGSRGNNADTSLTGNGRPAFKRAEAEPEGVPAKKRKAATESSGLPRPVVQKRALVKMQGDDDVYGGVGDDGGGITKGKPNTEGEKAEEFEQQTIDAKEASQVSHSGAQAGWEPHRVAPGRVAAGQSSLSAASLRNRQRQLASQGPLGKVRPGLTGATQSMSGSEHPQVEQPRSRKGSLEGPERTMVAERSTRHIAGDQGDGKKKLPGSGADGGVHDSSLRNLKRKAEGNAESEGGGGGKEVEQQQVQAPVIRQQKKVKVNVFAAEKFADLGLAGILADHVEGHLGFKAPTHIQQAAIPGLLTGRDGLIQASTGSGKTLVYLLPLFHFLQAQEPKVSRSDGTYALILAPTRELCLQIHAVAVQLSRRFVWIVPGHVMGGESKSKEKARLRKGVTLLVATPGRLLDHMRTTQAFCLDKCQWIVIDEADRLLDLGFEKDMQEILRIVGEGADARSDATDVRDPVKAKSGKSHASRRRQTILLSATLTTRVESLAAVSLHDPIVVGMDDGHPDAGATAGSAGVGDGAQAQPETSKVLKHKSSALEDNQSDFFEEQEKAKSREVYRIPAQLVQKVIKVPCRLRLIALTALLRSLSKRAASRGGCKALVFFSTCDSVEFHHQLFTTFPFSTRSRNPSSSAQRDSSFEGNDNSRNFGKVSGGSGYGSGAKDSKGEGGARDGEVEKFITFPVFKLHGQLTQKDRAEAFLAFGRVTSGVLLCTDVAARGLDFPVVSHIVQYDPAGEADDYVHRVGRTARLGQRGEALLFLQPSESDYVAELTRHSVTLQNEPLVPLFDSLPMGTKKGKDRGKQRAPAARRHEVGEWGEDLGEGGGKDEYMKAFMQSGRRMGDTDEEEGEGEGGEVSLAENHFGGAVLHSRLEAFIASKADLYLLATDAFRSFLRAYAAHRGRLKLIFHPKSLHFGHVAKSFGLQDAPSLLGQSSTKKKLQKEKAERFVRKKKKYNRAAVMAE
eukprot:TRINITY_DN20152_c0_g1_i1.p1 TRINITY_DN20152_c0_g1~~TRINITY_DN20152_c0_g1_i1.p1  ORF type:complete len:1100 (-),score=220.58 TRINITY_DN20152_c0_g1_i1:9-3263(-)